MLGSPIIGSSNVNIPPLKKRKVDNVLTPQESKLVEENKEEYPKYYHVLQGVSTKESEGLGFPAEIDPEIIKQMLKEEQEPANIYAKRSSPSSITNSPTRPRSSAITPGSQKGSKSPFSKLFFPKRSP